MELFYIVLLGFSVSADGFFAGFAYGIKKIRLPAASLLVVGAVTLLCAGLGLFGAAYIGKFFNPRPAVFTGAILLILMGAFNLFQQYMDQMNLGSGQPRPITISIGNLIISIMAKPESADVDQSCVISASEAVFLGLALGLDNMAAAFAAALAGFVPIYTPLVMALIQMAVIAAGIRAAAKIASPCFNRRFCYLPGLILLIMGFLRLY